LNEKKSQLDHQNNINKTDAQLAVLNRDKGYVENLFKELKKLKPFLSSEEVTWQKQERVDEQKNKLKDELNNITSKLQYYQAMVQSKQLKDTEIANIIKKHSPQYGYLNEEQLKERISKLNTDLSDEKATERDLDRKNRNLKDQINDLESKKEHKYKKYEEQLVEFGEKIRLLDHKINNEYSSYLEDIKKGIETNNPKEEQKKYTEEIFIYLGRRLGTIALHTGENVLIKKVNLFTGTLESSDGGLYRLRDMGTGQGQAAYLKGLLSTDDDRLIIAMFDEVGLMDEDTLMQIKSKLKELYDENRLLLGLIVQKKEKEMEVLSLQNA
jgi:DNA repair protein SbcC/Rad50